MKYILKYVSKASRYVSIEDNKQKRTLNGIEIALFFNGSYDASIASYGFQSLYHVMSGETAFTPYRYFLPETDYLDILRQNPCINLRSNDDSKMLSELEYFFLYSEEENTLLLLPALDLLGIQSIDILIQHSSVLNPILSNLSDCVLIGKDPFKIKGIVKNSKSLEDLKKSLKEGGKVSNLELFKGFGTLYRFITPIVAIQANMSTFAYLHAAQQSFSSDIFNSESKSWEILHQSNQKQLNQAVNNIPTENEISLFPLGISNRLRQINHIKLTYLEIFPTIKKILSAGWRNIHLYFWVGHPLEEKEDWREFKKEIQGIFEFVQMYKKISISLHIAIFSPCPKSCFIWDEYINNEQYMVIKRNIEKLLEEKKNFRLHIEAFSNYLSRLIAFRGSRDKANKIMTYLRETDLSFLEFDLTTLNHFNHEIFSPLFEAVPIGEDFPNVFKGIDIKNRIEERKIISKKIAKKIEVEVAELDLKLIKKALPNLNIYLSKTLDQAAGILGSKEIQYGRITRLRASQSDDISKRYRLKFARTKNLIYYTHQEIKEIFIYYLKRVKIPMRMTKAFHPTPKITFSSPTNIGVELLSEYFDIEVNSIRTVHFSRLLNPIFPDGLKIVEEKEIYPKTCSLTACINLMEYKISFPITCFDKQLETELRTNKYSFLRSTKNGDLELELAPFIHKIDVDSNDILIQLINVDNRLLKINELVDILLSISPFDPRTINIKKTKQFVFKDGQYIDPMNAK